MKNVFLTSCMVLIAFIASSGPVQCADSDYRIGDGDVLRIMVYDHPDLTTNAQVSGGRIHFPLIGQTLISGMTSSKAAETLAAKLAEGYIVNPQVSVFIEEFRSKKVTIMGQVNEPGLYELNGPTTLLELISKAGGVSRESGDTLTVRRKASGTSEEQITIDLKELLEKGDTSKNIDILDGDSVFVPKAGIFYVTGQVNRPDAYKLEKGASIIQAITMAGGFTNIAAQNKVKVIRKIDGKERVLEKIPMQAPVFNGDVIVVPESFF